MKTLILAGGCFWGVDAYFRQLKGVIDTKSGYANGNKDNPTYQEVCNGIATHAEAVKIDYDPKVITLNELLEQFFRIIDPTTLNRQGNDVGVQYRSGIYYDDEMTKETALAFIAKAQLEHTKKIVVQVEALTQFYLAEDYHQEYLQKNPTGYCHIDLNLAKASEKK